jgi:hypothetical protein
MRRALLSFILLCFWAANVYAADKPFFRLLEHEFEGPYKATVFSWFPQHPIIEHLLFHEDFVYAISAHAISVYDNTRTTNATFRGQFNRPLYRGPLNPPFTSSKIRSPVIDQNRLYWATYKDIEIYDISVPLDPLLIGRMTNFFAHGQIGDFFLVRSNTIFTLTGGNLVVADLSNPRQPVLLSETPTKMLSCVNISGPRLLVGRIQLDGDVFVTNQAQVFDISKPSAPELVAEFEEGSTSLGFASTLVENSLVYIQPGLSRLSVIDLNDRSKPPARYTVNTPQGLYTFGTNVFVPTLSGTLLYELSSPSALRRVATIGGGLGTGSLYVRGDRLCQIEFGAIAPRLSVYDISDRPRPRRMASEPLTTTPLPITDLRGIRDDCAHLGSGDVIDLSNLGAPRKVTLSETTNPDLWVGTTGYRINQAKLSVIDLSERLRRRIVRTLSLGGPGIRMEADNDHLYVLSGNETNQSARIEIFSLVEPANPQLLARIEYPDGAIVFHADGDLLFESSGSAVRIQDLSDPANPVSRGIVNVLPGTYDLRRFGNYLYASSVIYAPKGSLFTTTIIDITNPDAPFVTRELEIAGDVQVRGSHLYISSLNVTFDDSEQLHIFNNTDPASPSLVSTLPVWGTLFFHDDFAFAGNHVIDISEPERASVVDVLPSALGYYPRGESNVVNWQRDQLIAYQLDRLTSRTSDFTETDRSAWQKVQISPGAAARAQMETVNGTLPLRGSDLDGIFVREDGLYSDVQVRVELPSAQLTGSNDVLKLFARIDQTRDGSIVFYSANLLTGANPELQLVKRATGNEVLLVSKPLPRPLSALPHRFEFELNGSRLRVRLLEVGPDREIIVCRAESSDADYAVGLTGLTGSNITLENYVVTGVAHPPSLTIGAPTALSWVDLSSAYALESAEIVTGPWHLLAGNSGAARRALITSISMPLAGKQMYFRLKGQKEP